MKNISLIAIAIYIVLGIEIETANACSMTPKGYSLNVFAAATKGIGESRQIIGIKRDQRGTILIKSLDNRGKCYLEGFKVREESPSSCSFIAHPDGAFRRCQ